MSNDNTKIFIRSLSKNQLSNLEEYKNKHNHKANSKAVLDMIERINNLETSLQAEIELKQELEIEFSEIKNEARTFATSLNKLIKL